MLLGDVGSVSYIKEFHSFILSKLLMFSWVFHVGQQLRPPTQAAVRRIFKKKKKKISVMCVVVGELKQEMESFRHNG